MFGLNDNQNDSPVKQDDKPVESPAVAPDEAAPANTPAQPANDKPATPPTSDPQQSDDDLINLKEQALKDLSPLVSHLDQTPDEKFKTLMMMIQAADNDSLIKEAYQTAGQIDDEKARAQALLDIVNEINYFTQKDNDGKTTD